jgi:P-type conjugative transfer protein TrbJ
MKKLALTTLLLLAVCRPAHAQFGSSIVFDPSMFGRQLEQLNAEVQSLRAALLNLKAMTGGSAWSNQAGYLDELGSLIATGNGLSYQLQNLQQQFTGTFPGYSGNGTLSPQQQSQRTLDTLMGSLQSLQAQSINFQNEGGELTSLAARNQGAPGALTALQLGNEISLAGANQAQQLRQLQMTAANAQAVAAANQIQAQVNQNNNSAVSLGAACTEPCPFHPQDIAQ